MIAKVLIAVKSNLVVKEAMKQKKSLVRKKKNYSNSHKNPTSAYTALAPDGAIFFSTSVAWKFEELRTNKYRKLKGEY